MSQDRKLFVGSGEGFTERIYVVDKQNPHCIRAVRWGKLTKKERARGEEFMDICKAPIRNADGLNFCTLKNACPPPTPEVARAMARYLNTLEHKYGTGVWILYAKPTRKQST